VYRDIVKQPAAELTTKDAKENNSMVENMKTDLVKEVA